MEQKFTPNRVSFVDAEPAGRIELANCAQTAILLFPSVQGDVGPLDTECKLYFRLLHFVLTAISDVTKTQLLVRNVPPRR